MIRGVFSSIDGGAAHRQLILDQIAAASATAWQTGRVASLQIMCFAFTDPAIRDAVLDFVKTTPQAKVRVLADWSQGAPKSASVVSDLANSRLRGLHVRLKIDAPYHRHPDTGRVSWGYHHSHGMLHHKSLCVLMDDTPHALVIGSFNWSGRGTKAYENTLLLERSNETLATLDAFDAEFRSMWTDPAISLPFERGADFALRARTIVQEGGSLHDLDTLAQLVPVDDAVPAPTDNTLVHGTMVPAFSGRRLTAQRPHYGFATTNAARKLNLLRPQGARKLAPVTLNSVALEGIRRVRNGHPIHVAMYALSPRVPEYSALLEAARRGCRVRIVLDGTLGRDMAARISDVAKSENLFFKVRTTNRRMHQKYVVAPKDDIVITGTANMTEDATARHAEHRLLIRENAGLTAQFNADFTTIWRRIAPAPNAKPTVTSPGATAHV